MVRQPKATKPRICRIIRDRIGRLMTKRLSGAASGRRPPTRRVKPPGSAMAKERTCSLTRPDIEVTVDRNTTGSIGTRAPAALVPESNTTDDYVVGPFPSEPPSNGEAVHTYYIVRN